LSSSFGRAKFGTGEQKAKRIMPGLSAWVNLLDYSTAVLPVTLADKNIDVVDVGYEPMNPTDEKVHKGCELLPPRRFLGDANEFR
jgi:amidase